MKNYDIAIIGCGHLGANLAKYLSKFFSITTFDIEPQSILLENLNIEHKICNVVDFNQLEEMIENPLIVIHTVATNLAKPPTNRLAYEINVKATQNVCEIVSKNQSIKGMILSSSWHVYGEQCLSGIITEDFGYRPDKVEKRAKVYALSKVMQDCITRFFDNKEDGKIYGALRLGTILDKDMSDETAAGKFISKALEGDDVTPYKHSMNRQIFYVSMDDVCKSFKAFIDHIIKNKKNDIDSLEHIFNVAYPQPITIFELANLIIESVKKNSNGSIIPKLSIIKTNEEELEQNIHKTELELDISKIKKVLKVSSLTNPKEVIDEIIKFKLNLLIKD